MGNQTKAAAKVNRAAHVNNLVKCREIGYPAFME
jgi:hypothetical protein